MTKILCFPHTLCALGTPWRSSRERLSYTSIKTRRHEDAKLNLCASLRDFLFSAPFSLDCVALARNDEPLVSLCLGGKKTLRDVFFTPIPSIGIKSFTFYHVCDRPKGDTYPAAGKVPHKTAPVGAHACLCLLTEIKRENRNKAYIFLVRRIAPVFESRERPV